ERRTGDVKRSGPDSRGATGQLVGYVTGRALGAGVDVAATLSVSHEAVGGTSADRIPCARRTRPRSRMTGGGSWFQSPPCASQARCSASTAIRSSANTQFAKCRSTGQARVNARRDRGLRTSMMPKARFARPLPPTGTYAVHRETLGAAGLFAPAI